MTYNSWSGSNVTPSADISGSGTTFSVTTAGDPWSLEITTRDAGVVETIDITETIGPPLLLPRSLSSRSNRRLHYVTPAYAEDPKVQNTSNPVAAATGNVTNQAVQFQNNGAPSRQIFGANNSCNGATMTFSRSIWATTPSRTKLMVMFGLTTTVCRCLSCTARRWHD